ncbi:MAG: hypothetical protein ACLGHQ_13850 [Acidimicrobiia bacterium]
MTDTATDAGPTGSPLLRRWRWVLYAATVLPFVTSAVRAIRDDWFPIGDSALLYLRTADVGTQHHPLLGSWSSASLSLGRNINNPGPLYDDLMAPFAHLFPTGVGNVVGVSVLNLGFVVLAALAARRIGGARYEAWTLVTAAALAWSLGSEVLFDIFQAHALLFPFLAVLVLLTGAMTGLRWTWPWLVVCWSVILQTHISYAYIAVVVVGTALLVAVPAVPTPRRAWVRAQVRSRSVLVSAVVLALAWIQPVVEQFTAEGEGNLSRLARSASGTDIAVGFGNAFRMVSAVFALPPWWSRWGFQDTIQPAGTVETSAGLRVDIPWLPGWVPATAAFVVLLGLLVAALRWSRHHEERLLVAVNALALGGLVGSVVALGRLTIGPVGLAAHHTRWLYVLALWSHAALVATGLRWLLARERRPDLARPVGHAALALAAVFAVANVPQYVQEHGPLADTSTMPALRRVFERLGPLDGVDPFLYRTDNLRVYEPYSSAIMAQLVDRGVEFRVDQEVMVRQLGPSRRADGTERAVVTQYQGWEGYSYDGPDCVLARVSEVGEAAERDLAAAAEAIEDRAAALDVSAVPGGPDMTDRDAALADAIVAGDRDAVHRAIVEGWYGWWIDHGLVHGDEATMRELLDLRPEMMRWVGTTFVLTVSPASVC